MDKAISTIPDIKNAKLEIAKVKMNKNAIKPPNPRYDNFKTSDIKNHYFSYQTSLYIISNTGINNDKIHTPTKNILRIKTNYKN